MAQTIYHSHLPPLDLPQKSIFAHLFTPDAHGNIGGHPGSSPAFIDADTSTTLSRATLRALALALAHGLTHPAGPTLPLRTGDTVLVLSPNSIVYPVVTFGIIAAGLRCTFANSAYTANELRHQWSDSGARLVFAHPSLVPTVAEMFRSGLGCSEEEVRRRVVVASAGWLTGVQDEGTLRSLPMPYLDTHSASCRHIAFHQLLHAAPRTPEPRVPRLRGPIRIGESPQRDRVPLLLKRDHRQAEGRRGPFPPLIATLYRDLILSRRQPTKTSCH